jgi:hypothetical protein
MKRGGPTLRKELDDIGYLESHPKVCHLFKDAGCYEFCKKCRALISWWQKNLLSHLMAERKSLPNMSSW